MKGKGGEEIKTRVQNLRGQKGGSRKRKTTWGREHGLKFVRLNDMRRGVR